MLPVIDEDNSDTFNDTATGRGNNGSDTETARSSILRRIYGRQASQRTNTSLSTTTTESHTAPHALQYVGWKKSISALLWKNWLLLWKRKNKYATALEILLPVLCMLALGICEQMSDVIDTPAGWSLAIVDDTGDSVLRTQGSMSLFAESLTPSVPRFVAQESSMTGLLVHLSSKAVVDAGTTGYKKGDANTVNCTNGLLQEGRVTGEMESVFVFADECRGLAAPYRIAIVPDNTFTREYFVGAATKWYPRISLRARVVQARKRQNRTVVVPSFKESVVFFKNENALESHMTAADYGANPANPKIYAALVFHAFPAAEQFGRPSSVKYSIRMSANSGNTVSTLKERVWDPLLTNQLDPTQYTTYATNGFLTLQTLVTKFSACQPHWNQTARTSNGTCQQQLPIQTPTNLSASFSVTDPEMETQFLKALGNDVLINEALQNFKWMGNVPLRDPSASANSGSEISFAKFVFNQTDLTQHLLLRPLRQLPQPFIAARYLPMPLRGIATRGFYHEFKDLFPIILGASYIYAVAKMIDTFIHERETHAREFLKVLGMRERYVWISWYVTYGMELLVGCVLQMVVLLAFEIFPSSSALLVFALLCVFAWSLLCCAFCVSAVFSNARTGSHVGVFLMVTIIALHDRLLENSPNGSYYIPQLVQSKGMRAFMSAEYARIGIGFSGLNSEVDGEKVGYSLLALLLHCVLYTLMGLYLERVIPKSYGTMARSSEAWYFPVLPSFWVRHRVEKASNGKLTAGVPATLSRTTRMNATAVSNDSSTDSAFVVHGSSSSGGAISASYSSSLDMVPLGHIRPLRADESKNALCLYRVSKSIPTVSGYRTVLDGVSLALPLGKITSIVGGSGAGKTTLMSVLQMRMWLTAGDMSFEDLSWKRDVRAARKMMGCCFQEDVLFPELTVLDHLQFYAKLKVFPSQASAKQEIDRRLAEFKLTHQCDIKAKHLAVSSRRKLTLAIAILQDTRSKFLFLDEPTLEMDPYTRKQTWEILRKNRENRVVVFTTSDLFEANAVSDQVAVLTNGQVQYSGSPARLKGSFQTGYILTLAKGAVFNERAVMDLVGACLHSEAAVVTNSEEEFVLRIPTECSGSLAKLFQQLETQSEGALGVTSHQLALARLEDAFADLTGALPRYSDLEDDPGVDFLPAPKKEAGPELDDVDLENPTIPGVLSPSNSTDPTNQHLWTIGSQRKSTRLTGQIAALLIHRLHVLNRERGRTLLVVLCPAMLLFVCMAAMGSLERTFDDPAFPLNARQLAKEVGPDDRVHLSYYCLDVADRTRQKGGLCGQVFSESIWGDATPVPVDRTRPSGRFFEPDMRKNLFGFDYGNLTSSNGTALDDNSYALWFEELLFKQGFIRDVEHVPNQFGAYLMYTAAQDTTTRSSILRPDLFVNTSVPHASGIFRAQLDDSLYKVMTGDATVSLEVINHPLPLTAQEKLEAISKQQGVTVNAFLVVLVLSYFPAIVVERLVAERSPSGNIKYHQWLAGTHIAAYWIANYVVDLGIYFLSGAMVLVVIVGSDITTWTGTAVDTSASSVRGDIVGSTGNPLEAVIALFVVFGFASCSFACFVSFFFRYERWYLTRVKAGLLFAGTSLVLFVVAGEILQDQSVLQELLVNILSFSPFFSFSYGLHRLAYVQVDKTSLFLLDPFHADVAGISLLFLCITSVLFFTLAIAMDVALTFPEVRRFVSKIPTSNIDGHGNEFVRASSPDVELEAARVDSQVVQKDKAGVDAILVHQVMRVFRDEAHSSVNQPVSFGVASGECLAILGVEGSGKSSLLKMISGEIVPSKGQVVIKGVDAFWNHKKLREAQQIAYCPQDNDCLVQKLSVREQIIIRAKLRNLGTDSRSYAALADQVLESMMLKAVQHKLVGTLHAAEKRKVCIALAVLGLPPVLILDEPTAGLDSASRDHVWHLLSRIRLEHNCAMIVATKSLEECEAVSSRVGIFHDGALSYIGSYDSLRGQFEYGWMLDVKFGDSSEQVSDLMASHFANDAKNEASVTYANLKSTCKKLGCREWSDRIHPAHSTGSWIASLLTHDGLVSAQTFYEWWVYETHYELLQVTLAEVFGSEHVRVLRRHADSCRFQLALEDSELKLSQVFKVLENAKKKSTIHDFAAAPSTFREVMNTFAQSAATKRQLRHAAEASCS